MKKLFYTTLFLSGIASVTAQPVLNASDLAPIGFTAPISVGASSAFNAGAAGAGQTWDLSTMAVNAVGDVTVVDPSTTPYFASYSGSNYAFKLVMGASTVYNYYTVSSTGFEMLGSEIGSADPNDYTPGPRLELQFPFTYQDAYTDAYQTTNMGSPGTLTRTPVWEGLTCSRKVENRPMTLR